MAVEVRFDVEPIEGRVSNDGGSIDRPFAGWLGLLAAIDAARPAAHEPDELNGGKR